jgi:hypothetical protein
MLVAAWVLLGVAFLLVVGVALVRLVDEVRKALDSEWWTRRPEYLCRAAAWGAMVLGLTAAYLIVGDVVLGS